MGCLVLAIAAVTAGFVLVELTAWIVSPLTEGAFGRWVWQRTAASGCGEQLDSSTSADTSPSWPRLDL